MLVYHWLKGRLILPVKNKEPIDVRAIREKLRMNQPQLAKRLGVTKGAVSQWESGVSSPSVTAAYMLRGLEAEFDSSKNVRTESKPADMVLEIRLTGESILLESLSKILTGLQK